MENTKGDLIKLYSTDASAFLFKNFNDTNPFVHTHDIHCKKWKPLREGFRQVTNLKPIH